MGKILCCTMANPRRWILPVAWLFSMASFGSCFSDCSSPLGMTSRAIKDHQITASSTFSDFTKPQEGRLRNQRLPGQLTFAGWCADANDPAPYLQIDFQQESVVRELATQGLEEPSGNWVTEYALNYSCDGVNWTTYKDKKGNQQKVFTGNNDDSTVVKSYLYSLPVITRMIRFLPLKKRHHGMTCMRVEVYGCKSNRDKKFSECSVPVGIESGRITDAQITSSSYSKGHFPYNGRLNKKVTVVNGNVSWGAWCTDEVQNTQYLQVDLGSTRSVSGVATQGYSGGWVTKYELQYSLNMTEWNTYKENNSSETKVFDGNWDRWTVFKHTFDDAVQARYIRFVPTASSNPARSICMRVEVYQCIYFEGCPRLPTTIKPTGTITSTQSNTEIPTTEEPCRNVNSLGSIIHPCHRGTPDKNHNVRNSNSKGSIIQVEFLALFLCFLCCLFIR